MNIFYPNLNQQNGKDQYAGRGYGTWAGAMKDYENKQAEEEKSRKMEKAKHERTVAFMNRTPSQHANAASDLASKHNDFEHHAMAAHLHQNAAKHLGDTPEGTSHFNKSRAHAETAKQLVANTGYAKAQAHRDAAER